MRHARVIWSIFFSLVVTPVICHGQAIVTLSPTSLIFSGQLLNTTSAGKAVTLTNSGNAGLTITSITASGNFGASSNCPISPSTLAAAAHCTITVTFKPSVSGSVSGEVTILDNASGSPHLVNLSGTGLTAISLSPTSLIFGTIAVGTTSAAKTVTLTNNLSTALIIGFSASGDYAVIGSGTTPCGSSLAGKAKCTMGVTFKPKSNGSINGAVTITYNSTFSPQEVALSGSGSGGPSSPLTFSPTSLAFTNQLVGTKSTSKTVTVTNSTALSLSISKIAASGNFAAAGSGATPCGGSLAAGAKCTIAVSFSPTINGVVKGAVAITNSTTVSPQVYNVSGTGALPLGFSPASITFAARPVGTTSSPVTVTLTNNQTTALTMSFAASGEFKLTPSGTTPCGASLAALAKCTLGVTFTPALAGTIKGVVTAAYTGGPYSPLEVKLTGTGQSTGDFSISALPSSLKISRGKSGGVQVTVTPLNGFTGTVTITPKNPPTGVTSVPINVAAGSSGTLTLNVSSATATGPFAISFTGTSGTLSHTAMVTLTVPYGGANLVIVPRTSGQYAMPQPVADYLSSLEKDVAPVRLKECGSESSAEEFDLTYNPADPEGTHTSTQYGAHYINIISLPTVPTDGSKHYTDYTVYETAHALQYDLLRNAPHRATQGDIEGFSQACSDLVYRKLAFSGKGIAPKTGGQDRMLWMDTLRRFDQQAVAGGAYADSNPLAQPMLAIGEDSFLTASTQTGAHGLNGVVEHENAIFAAEFATYTGAPLTSADRVQAWDATGMTLDGQSAGQWISEEMIQDPVFTVGKTSLIAWPEYPQLPAQMMAQAFTVTSVTPSANPSQPGGIPTVAAITSGPLTITVKDMHGKVVLGPIAADFSETTQIANFTPNLQNQLAPGTYTVFVDATVNSTALESKFTIAVIPFDKTGLGTDDLNFPGQYLIAVDSAGNANGGSLTVTRGSVVPLTPSIPGFAIVQPDSTGTFDVKGPSGASHTYTAPAPWARFIPVE
jgi:hypothetical protein